MATRQFWQDKSGVQGRDAQVPPYGMHTLVTVSIVGFRFRLGLGIGSCRLLWRLPVP